MPAAATASHHPILWKHRDTGAPHNFIAQHPATDSTFGYIALHNSTDTLGLEAWIGMNRAGLAVMNTASYNLAPDTARIKDREGFVMTRALQICRSVDDFATLLDTLPRPLGIQANFGVLDALGKAAYFEACDTGYTRYDIPDDSPAVVRTNYSHSGASRGRLGIMRERAARHFLDSKTNISAGYLTDTLSSSFFDARSGRDLLVSADSIAVDRGDLIPRYISTASVAIEAAPSAASDGESYIMWVRLGYPPVAETFKVTFDNVPAELLPGTDGITPAERRADRRKNSVYHRPRRDGNRVIDLEELRKILK